MKYRRHFLSLLFVLAVLPFQSLLPDLAASQARAERKFDIKSYSIRSIVPESLSAVSGSVLFSIENSGSELKFSDISGEMIYGAETFGVFTVADFAIPRKGGDVLVSGRVALPAGKTALDLLPIVKNFNVNNCYVNIRLKLSSGIFSKNVNLDHYPISQLMR